MRTGDMTQDERHRLGLACKQILADDNFKFVAAKVREDVINAWMGAALNDTPTQSAAKQTMTGLDLLLTKLSAFAADATMLNAEAEVAQKKVDRAQERKDKRAERLKSLGIGQP